jgi:hypothetical protein
MVGILYKSVCKPLIYVYKTLSMFSLLASCSEYAGTILEAPLDVSITSAAYRVYARSK